METKSYDLGYTYDEPTALASSPDKESESSEKPKMHYPSLYMGNLKEVIDLPDEGEAIIKFKVTERAVTDRNGEKSCRLDLEVHSLSPLSSSKETSSSKSGDLDSAMKAIEAGLKSEESEESED
jgi:hypothetical protein